MKRLGVFWHFALRCVGWNLLAGGLLAGGYGMILGILLLVREASFEWSLLSLGGSLAIVFYAGIVGAVSGFFLGLVVGLANGLMLGGLTVVFFFPNVQVENYRAALGCGGMAVSIFCCLALGPSLERWSDPWLPDFTPIELWVLIVGIPALVASGVSWWASRRLSRWYYRFLNMTETEAA